MMTTWESWPASTAAFIDRPWAAMVPPTWNPLFTCLNGSVLDRECIASNNSIRALVQTKHQLHFRLHDLTRPGVRIGFWKFALATKDGEGNVNYFNFNL